MSAPFFGFANFLFLNKQEGATSTRERRLDLRCFSAANHDSAFDAGSAPQAEDNRDSLDRCRPFGPRLERSWHTVRLAHVLRAGLFPITPGA